MTALSTQVEDRMLARIRAGQEAMGVRWGCLKGYEGELETPAQLTALVGRTPACLVHGAGWITKEGSGAWLATVTFQLVVISRPARDPRTRRHGGAAGPGVLGLAEDLARLFVGQRLGLDEIMPFAPGPLQVLWAGTAEDAKRREGSEVSILALDLVTGWFLAADPAAALPAGWPTDLDPGHGLVFSAGEGPEGGDTSRGAGELQTIGGTIRIPPDTADAAGLLVEFEK